MKKIIIIGILISISVIVFFIVSSKLKLKEEAREISKDIKAMIADTKAIHKIGSELLLKKDRGYDAYLSLINSQIKSLNLSLDSFIPSSNNKKEQYLLMKKSLYEVSKNRYLFDSQDLVNAYKTLKDIYTDKRFDQKVRRKAGIHIANLSSWAYNKDFILSNVFTGKFTHLLSGSTNDNINMAIVNLYLDTAKVEESVEGYF
jgi:hypothetical protein